MRHTILMRLSVAAVLTAIATTAMADAIGNYKEEVSKAIGQWISETNPDDVQLGNMFLELDRLSLDSTATLDDVKKQQDLITNFKSGTIESTHESSVLNAVGQRIPSPLLTDASLAERKGTGPQLADWMKDEIRKQVKDKGWTQIKGVEPEVTWSDDSFNGNNPPAIRLTFRYARDEKSVQTLKMR